MGGKNNTFFDISLECRIDATCNTGSLFFFFFPPIVLTIQQRNILFRGLNLTSKYFLDRT